MAERYKPVPTSFFDVNLITASGAINGHFAKVSGLGIQLEYETYYEGGSMYPRFFYKQSKPQTMTLEQGLIYNSKDWFSWWALSMNQGMMIPAATGVIRLKDAKGTVQRVWTVAGAYLTKYEGPSLEATKPVVAVNRIELIYGGVF